MKKLIADLIASAFSMGAFAQAALAPEQAAEDCFAIKVISPGQLRAHE